jgi:anti-sigma factor RsiW
MKDCEELLSGISDYVDGTASKELCAELQRHMEGCHNCRVVVDSIQKTIRLYKGDEEVDLPEGFQARLHGTLRDAWERKHGKTA